MSETFRIFRKYTGKFPAFDFFGKFSSILIADKMVSCETVGYLRIMNFASKCLAINFLNSAAANIGLE